MIKFLWPHEENLPDMTLLKLMSIESVMPSYNLILCCLLLLPSIFPSIRVFSNKLAYSIRWQKLKSFIALSLFTFTITNQTFTKLSKDYWVCTTVFAAAKLLQSCPTLCDPIDISPPDSPVPGILQARTLEWVAISFSNAWKWKVKVKSLSHVRLLVCLGHNKPYKPLKIS